MNFSKKQLSIFIEILFTILFSIFFLPNFYENRLGTYDFNSSLGKLIEITIFSIIYFSLSYTLLGIFIKKKLVNDERDILIDLKSYKIGYILYETSLFSFIGVILSVAIFDSQIYQSNGGLIFMVIVWLLAVTFIKSIYQLYLYKIS